MEEQCISVRNLTKSFGDRTVVDNLSFDVKQGEVFALLGHNGAGGEHYRAVSAQTCTVPLRIC